MDYKSMIVGVSIATCIALFLFGCAPLKQYRALEKPQSTDCEPGASPDTCPIVILGDRADYSLNIIEFDDQGDLFSNKLATAVVEEIENSKRNDDKHEGKLVVVFAHGWFHSADPKDENLRFFKEMLERMTVVERTAAQAQNRKPRKVYGIFMAWRGTSLEVWGLKILTFWNRKDTAHRIGERSATEMLIRLQKAAYSVPANSDQWPNRFIVMGHSFGGALVYSAMSQMVARSLLSPPTRSGQHPVLADAVILFNPAFEASRIQNLLETASSLYGERRPTLSIFTSESDRATGLAFPAARFVNTLIEKYRDVPNPIKAGQVVDQRFANVDAVGHFKPFLTHRLVTAKTGTSCPENVATMHPAFSESRSALDSADPAAINSVGDKALAAQRDVEEAYESGAPILFGKTCLIPNVDLTRKQLAVFNVSMEDAVWSGHTIEQSDGRTTLMLDFLEQFIPFAAASLPTTEPDATQNKLLVEHLHTGIVKRRPRASF